MTKSFLVCTAAAVLYVATALTAATPARASGGPGGGGDIRLFTTGNCGDQMRMRVRNSGDTIELDVTIPSADPAEVWRLTATQQDYNALSGGRVGRPVSLVPNPLPPPAFSTAEGGFATAGNVGNTDNLTHGISCTATRSSPTALTCTNKGFWTNPSGTGFGPAPQNPAGRPDTAPAFADESEADLGSHDASILMDQEMLATGLGVPPANRFTVRVNGVARTSTVVRIVNDDPPDQAVVDVTFGGLPLASTDTVTVQYSKPLGNTAAQLQDLEAVKTASFGPVTVPVL